MSTKTTNYNLTLPAQEEYYNVDIFNDNYTIIDEELKKLNDVASRGAKVYTLNEDSFKGSINNMYYAEIHSCAKRVVYVGLLDPTQREIAQECGMMIYNISAVQGAVGIQVKTKPSENIQVVVADLGSYINDGQAAVVIDGIGVSSYTPTNE